MAPSYIHHHFAASRVPDLQERAVRTMVFSFPEATKRHQKKPRGLA
jgi:hypothetical protein